MTRHVSRMIVLAASLSGAVINSAFAIRLLSVWRSARWEHESEWDGTDTWKVDPVKLVMGMLSVYFTIAAVLSYVGFFGVARKIPSWVRLYRDFTIADFAFMTVSTIAVGYSVSTSPYVRTGACEELSRQSDFLRDIAETGLSLENCEYWFETAIGGVLGISFVLIAIRLLFLIFLAKHYTQVRRERQPRSHAASLRPVKTDSLQRIYLLPTPTHSTFPSHIHHDSLNGVVVYAPVSSDRMTEQEARNMNATEAWISTSSPHSPRHARSHSRTSSRSGSGRYRDELSGDEKLVDVSA